MERGDAAEGAGADGGVGAGEAGEAGDAYALCGDEGGWGVVGG